VAIRAPFATRLVNGGRTGEERVELADPAGGAQVDSLVSEVDDEATKDALVDLVLDLERLALGLLRRLERLLDPLERRRLERRRRGDGNGQEAGVSRGEGEEVGEDGRGERKPGVGREDIKEVGSDLVSGEAVARRARPSDEG
jgi:hypothetical protein